MRLRVQQLRESRGGRPGPPVPNTPYGLCERKATLSERDLLTVAAGRHSTSSDENCKKKQGQWIKLIRFFTFLESLHRADYTEVFFDIFVVYVQKKERKNKQRKQQQQQQHNLGFENLQFSELK